MPRTKPADPNPALEERIEEMVATLRDSMMPLIEEAGGRPIRPSRLGRRLGLDKTLASRLSRAFRAETAAELLHLLPSPAGLRIVLRRAEAVGLDAILTMRATECVNRYDLFLDRLPGGRAGLDANLSDTNPEIGEKRRRSSRQAVFKGLSFLMGYRCDAMATALVLQPSEGGRSVDAIELHHRIGVSRLRPRTPLALLSLDLDADGDAPESPWVETLEGESGLADPSGFLMSEFGNDPPPRVETFQIGGQTMFVLADGDPPLGVPVDLTAAYRVRRCWALDPEATPRHPVRSYLLHLPCKVLVRDLFVREDLYLGALPEVTHELPGTPSELELASVRRELLEGISTLDLASPIEQLPRGLHGASTASLPRYRAALSETFRRSGWDPSRFRGYRCLIRYPVPLVTMNWRLRATRPAGA